jgi:hypothetical protein
LNYTLTSNHRSLQYQKQLADSQKSAQEIGDKLDSERIRRQRGDEEIKVGGDA